MNPGRYIVDVAQDFTMIWTPLSGENLFQAHWKPNAPFSYDQWIDCMEANSKINSGLWNAFEMRGNRLTSAFHVAACYEVLLSLGCLPELNNYKVAELFNSIGANIKTPKVLKCDCIELCDYYHSVFRRLPEV